MSKSNSADNSFASESIVLGGGCFWCLDAIFRRVKGVINVQTGYAGGKELNPCYESIHANTTGHAEVVKVAFDPKTIPLKNILKIFWSIHDPTQGNRQDSDIGEQYRSIILYADEGQRQAAINSLKYDAAKLYGNKITTELKRLNRFYPAEERHQNYYAKNPTGGYCEAVISPKLAKFQRNFSEYLKPAAQPSRVVARRKDCYTAYV